MKENNFTWKTIFNKFKELPNNTIFHRNGSCYTKNYKIMKERGYTKDFKLCKNIYSDNDTVGTFVKRNNRIHYALKASIIVPFVMIIKKVCGKWLVKDIKYKPWHRNLWIFDKAYENAMIDWADYYFALGHCKTLKDRTKKYILGVLNSGVGLLLRSMKQIMLTVLKNDTAYLEFFNILMYNISKEMNNFYKGEDHIEHVFYTTRAVDDVRYFYVMNYLDKKTNKNCFKMSRIQSPNNVKRNTINIKDKRLDEIRTKTTKRYTQ